MTHPEDTTIRYDPLYGPPQRIRFQPRSDDRWRRVTEAWTGCVWRATGSEVVEQVTVVDPDGDPGP